MYALNYIQIVVIKINIFTIEYDGILSCDFGLHLATVDNDGFEVESGVDPEVISAEIPRYEGKLIFGVKQNGEFEFPLSLMSEKVIDFESMKKIKDWLFHHNKPCKFRFIGEGYSDWFYYAFISYDKDYIDGNGFRGIKVKVKSVSPYAYGNIVTYSYNLLELAKGQHDKYERYDSDHNIVRNVNITIPYVETANVYGVKPIVTITSIVPTSQQFSDQALENTHLSEADGGSVFNSFTNVATGESLWYTIKNRSDLGTSSNPTVIRIDCHKGIIEAKSGDTKINFYNNFKEGIHSAMATNSGSTISTFPSLVKGENNFVFYGYMQSVKIEYVPSIRLGAW